MNTEDAGLLKEIDLIQGCVERMSRNSFLVKRWAVSVFAAIVAISSPEAMTDIPRVICTVVAPLLCFWLLDSFFLHTEKKYRAMYDWMLEHREDGDMTYRYNLNPNRFNRKAGCLFCTVLSTTLVLFYLIPLLSITLFVVWKAVWPDVPPVK